MFIFSCSKNDGFAPAGNSVGSPSATNPVPPIDIPLPGSNVGVQPAWVPQFSGIVLSNSLKANNSLPNNSIITSAVGTNAIISDLNGSLLNPAAGITTGGGLTLDGVDDSISFGDAPSYQITSDLTISLWYKKNLESTDWTRIIGKGDSTNRNYGIWEEPGVSKKLLIQIYCVTSQCVNMTSSGSVNTGSWYHIVLVRSGNTILLYVNGTLDQSTVMAGIPKTSTDPLTVGWSFHGFQNMSAGEVTVWNSGLTAGDVQTVFNYQRSAFGL